MARLLGVIGNRPDLGSRAIELESKALRVRRGKEEESGWGVGFYQGGEILLKRRPIDDRSEISFVDMTRDIKADCFIAHVRAATVGTSRTENTHPFRYRHWLFAHTGTVPAFQTLRGRLIETLQPFLQRDVRGETDSELLFHLFLSFLHDAGQLDRPSVAAADARTAVRSTISLVDRLCAEEGAEPTAMNLLITSPDYLLAVHGGAAMAVRTIKEQTDIERLFGSNNELNRMRIPDLAACRVSLVASDFEDDRLPTTWKPVPSRSIVTLTRTDSAIEPV